MIRDTPSVGRFCGCIAAVILLHVPGADAHGQDRCGEIDAGRSKCAAPPVGDSGYLGSSAIILGVNALSGGVAAGIGQELRGGSFWNGFRRGALGGAAIFAGKLVAVESFDGAGLAGRQIAAAGASIVRNAGAGRPSLAELVLPVGPARVYLRPRGEVPVRVQLDAPGLAMLGQAILDDGYQMDYAASLSAGAPVFRSHGFPPDVPWTGRASAGVIRLSRRLEALPAQRRQHVIAHEVVHVIQYDQAFIALGEPLESALVPRLPGGGAVARRVDFGLDLILWLAADRWVSYPDRPWEVEADILSRTRLLETGAGEITEVRSQ